MNEHPVLPDLSPAKALRELWVVGFDIAAMVASLLCMVALGAFVLGRNLLGTRAVIGVLLCCAVVLRLRVARKNLELG